MKQNNGQIDHKRRSVHWTLHVLFGQKKLYMSSKNVFM